MLKRLLHLAVYGFQALRRSVWFVTRPPSTGVHAVPLTPEGKVVLVTLSYAHGWRLPGGGHKPSEPAETAMLRELREEIGLKGCTSIELVANFRHRPDFRRGRGSLFIVREVTYQPPRWSLEVAKVGEFALDDLPADTSRITYRLLELAKPQLRNPIAATKPATD
jgi:8-oxo-dGTP pyrophosphatase MutT (NUDIX family)